jgi:hypothetical protein
MATTETRARVPAATAALVEAAPVSSLPTVADMQQRMAWMTAMRPVMLEFIHQHMDPARHMYSFENNRYTPMTRQALRQMFEEGKAPALNQNGIHNLMSLYECYPDDPQIHEERADGFYTCRATVRLVSFRSGQPMGAGTGSCSTRESKYAYRWVGERQIPKGVDKATLKQRQAEGRTGTYTRYRLDNEDLADVEATVLQMAVKRAKSAAVKALPLVSEMFAQVGDPDEETPSEDAERHAVLAPLATWLRGLRASTQVKAILAVFGEPLRANDLPQLDEDRLAVAGQVVEIATRAGVAWDSATLVADVQRAVRASAAQAHADLFGAVGGAAATMPEGRQPPQAATTPPAGVPKEGPKPAHATEAPRGQKQGMAWKTLQTYQDDARLPVPLLEQVHTALSTDEPATEAEAERLAGVVLEWVDAAAAAGAEGEGIV